MSNFSKRIATEVESWAHHCTRKGKRSSRQWRHTSSSDPKIFKIQSFALKSWRFSTWIFRGHPRGSSAKRKVNGSC